MKFRILAIAAVLLLLIGVNVTAADTEYNITVDENFLSARRGEDLSQVSKAIGIDEAELSTYFNKNGLLYIAVSPDNSTQIRLAAFTDNFSTSAVDINNLDDAALQEFLASLSTDTENPATIAESGGRKFAVIAETLTDSGGKYTVTQYITVCGGKSYYLSCYNNGEGTSDTVKAAFESFSITEEAEQPFKWINVAIVFGIAAFAVISVVMIIGIIKASKIKD